MDIIGEPPPQVVWTFLETRLHNSENIEILDREYHSDLSIIKATRKQSGKYMITATNASGKDSVAVDVVVLGKWLIYRPVTGIIFLSEGRALPSLLHYLLITLALSASRGYL